MLAQASLVPDEVNSRFVSPTICVMVGPEKKPYYLHTDMLEERCPFFRARANFHAAGSDEDRNHIMLGDITTCDAFDMLVEYVYTSVYTIPKQMGVEEVCVLHIRVYHLANYLMMDDLRQIALAKTKTTLKGDDWGTFRKIWTSRAVIDLLRLVYDDTVWGQVTTGLAYDEGRRSIATGAEQERHDFSEEDQKCRLFASEKGEESDLVSCPLHEMRTLIAQFAASQLDNLRHDAEFRRMVRVGGDLVADVFSFVRPGSGL